MRRMIPTPEQIDKTGEWIAGHQRADGAILYFPNGKLDPWDHVESAMALAVTGRYEAAEEAFRYLARTQGADGAWPAVCTGEAVTDPTRDSNHAAYLASGLWHLHCARPNTAFLAEMWPVLERALAFVLALQEENGAIFWATNGAGIPWQAPLLTGNSSVYGSLRCAERIAGLLGRPRPEWTIARKRLGSALRSEHPVYFTTDLPKPVGYFAMDWYYPVLGGAVRGPAARHRLLRDYEAWVVKGEGCRCVTGRPWFTVAETCELVLALDACGLTDLALECFTDVHRLRGEDGGYWTGFGYENGKPLLWPEERPSWTAAAVVLATDALLRESATSGFFRELGDEQDAAWESDTRWIEDQPMVAAEQRAMPDVQ